MKNFNLNKRELILKQRAGKLKVFKLKILRKLNLKKIKFIL